MPSATVRCKECDLPLVGRDLCLFCGDVSVVGRLKAPPPPSPTSRFTARYRCQWWYPLVGIPVGLAASLFGLLFTLVVVLTPAEPPPEGASPEDLPPAFYLVVGAGAGLAFLLCGLRILFGRAVSLSTDGTTLWWRAPFAGGSRPLSDLRIVKCNRMQANFLGGAIGALASAIAHGRNHKLVFSGGLFAIHVYTGPGFRAFVNVLLDLNPHLTLELSPTAPKGWFNANAGFSCERLPIEQPDDAPPRFDADLTTRGGLRSPAARP